MTEFLKVLALAVLQGVTEFLPVSSSGHLVLAGELLGVESPGATLEVFLHAGTLGSILVFYRKQLTRLVAGTFRRDADTLRWVGKLALSAIPAATLFLAAGDRLEEAFDQARWVGLALCLTGLLLLASRRGRARDGASVRWWDAVWIGVAQAIALLPGISRSGSTISAARMRGVAPAVAAEFSFLMVIPLLAGATLKEALALCGDGAACPIPVPVLLSGTALAGVVGFFALTWLVRLLNRGRFWWFGVYCLVVGSVATAWLWG